ncbi:hypothetical protein CHS0354_000632 [Potamilus streckersoni]|uniref:riboflavin kinase n=1 Tax=Potamilus streckersoni TaxID=2493646 RepID=A0AAE0T7P4_9BIVA|nr:hypothetical protein CHS0354_000632 [Potamilus streckersoni]
MDLVINEKGMWSFCRSKSIEYGFNLSVINKHSILGIEVSSSNVKALISNGDFDMVKNLLGEPYYLTGMVIHGDGKGTSLGYPTANLKVDETKFIPSNGVYLVSVRVGEINYTGLMNIGRKPTVSFSNRLHLEVHILKYSGDLYVVSVLVLVYMLFLSPYNQLVSKDEFIKGKFAVVETQYQRRMDLIPNIVKSVEGYANFEKSTLTEVIEARAKATSINIDPTKITPENINMLQNAQSELSGALSRLLVTVEKYPDLKAEKGFSDLRSQLEGTENRIAVARNDFNTAVQDYNMYIRKFPSNITASIYGFTQKGYFQSAKDAEKAPNVEFNFGK